MGHNIVVLVVLSWGVNYTCHLCISSNHKYTGLLYKYTTWYTADKIYKIILNNRIFPRVSSLTELNIVKVYMCLCVKENCLDDTYSRTHNILLPMAVTTLLPAECRPKCGIISCKIQYHVERESKILSRTRHKQRTQIHWAESIKFSTRFK